MTSIYLRLLITQYAAQSWLDLVCGGSHVWIYSPATVGPESGVEGQRHGSRRQVHVGERRAERGRHRAWRAI